MPSILACANRPVLKYLLVNSFNNVTLTIHSLNPNSVITTLQLEQYFIDSLKPNLNVDLSAKSTAFHEPLSRREYFSNIRGTGIFIYDIKTGCLVFTSASLQYLEDFLSIHKNTVHKYSIQGKLFLGRFWLSLDILPELNNSKPLDLESFKALLTQCRMEQDKSKGKPQSKQILAQNSLNPTLTKTYSSIKAFAAAVKGDRGTIRSYLNKPGFLYRKQ